MAPTNESLSDLVDYLAREDGLQLHWTSTTLTVNLSGLAAEPEMLASARLALDAWEATTGFRFNETTGAANITFDTNSASAVTNYSYYSDGRIATATVSVAEDWMDHFPADQRWGVGDYGTQTFIHEIGHALGLDHGGPYNGSGTYEEDAIFAKDTWQYSVMSYFDQSNYGDASYVMLATPMLADIAAIRQIYGVLDVNLGATNYGIVGAFDFAEDAAFTIADDGGIDVIDLRRMTEDMRLDLNAGAFSDVNGFVKNLAIALGTTIENAFGGRGGDEMTGNDASNQLRGFGGSDILVGGVGDDTLLGGSGGDELTGGAGVDRFLYGRMNEFNGDLITDFASGVDRLLLSDIDADATLAGDQDFDLIGTRAFSGAAGELRYALRSDGTTNLMGDVDGDGVRDFILRFEGHVALTGVDIVG